jgi:hypothetical protein
MSAISDLNNFKAEGEGHSSRHLSTVFLISAESTVAIPKLGELQGINDDKYQILY